MERDSIELIASVRCYIQIGVFGEVRTRNRNEVPVEYYVVPGKTFCRRDECVEPERAPTTVCYSIGSGRALTQQNTRNDKQIVCSIFPSFSVFWDWELE